MKLEVNMNSESIFNEYGTYGSEYSSDSIWNEYGPYGGEYSSNSPFNSYISAPPVLVKNGRAIAYLRVNKFLAEFRRYVLILCNRLLRMKK